MTRRISFISIIGAALVLAAPAFGKGERFEQTPQWKQALEARSEGLNQQHGLGRYATAVPPSRLTESIASREAMERAMLQAERRYDFFQDAGLAGVDTRAELRRASYVAVTAGPDADPSSTVAGRTGVFEAMNEAVSGRGLGVSATVDPSSTVAGRTRVFEAMTQATANPVSIEVTNGREIEWPQVGIGLGIGLLLGLGLVMAIRHTRIRPLAH